MSRGERERVKSRRYYARHRDAECARKRAYTARLSAAVFAHYGRVCACCGTAGDLTIDHEDGRGREHREAVLGTSQRTGRPFYRWLISEGFPPGYSTMCRRCNTSKGRTAACRLDHAERRAA
jgi:hypothetical protein